MNDLTKATNALRANVKKRRPKVGVTKKSRTKTRKDNYQLSIKRFVKKKYQQTGNESGAGHILNHDLETTNLQIMLQNPCGVLRTTHNILYNRDGLMDAERLTELHRLDVDILCLPETNLNWRNEYVQEKWRKTVQRAWPKARIFYSSISGDKADTYRQGGVCTIVNRKWAPFVTSGTHDPLGRWTHIVLSGQKKQKYL